MPSLSKTLITTIKNTIPLDLGQGNLRTTTKGKLIALDLVPDGQGRRALDVGAREGNQTRWLESRGYEVEPIDIEPGFDGCKVVNVDEGLPYDDDSFDLVWCSEVIEHLQFPDKAIREFRRVTRPGGEIIMTTPNSYALLFRAISVFGLTPERIQRDDHIHFFDQRDIERLAPDAELYGYFPYMVIRRTIKQAIGALSPTFVMHIRVQKDPASSSARSRS